MTGENCRVKCETDNTMPSTTIVSARRMCGCIQCGKK